jgi:hypothetical protein
MQLGGLWPRSQLDVQPSLLGCLRRFSFSSRRRLISLITPKKRQTLKTISEPTGVALLREVEVLLLRATLAPVLDQIRQIAPAEKADALVAQFQEGDLRYGPGCGLSQPLAIPEPSGEHLCTSQPVHKSEHL